MNGRQTWMVAACAMLAVMPASQLSATNGRDWASGPDMVRQFLQSGPPAVWSYRARRTLEATAQDGRMRATLEAVVRLENGRFSYEIASERGSSILRTFVLERALEEERRTINEGRTGEAALTEANYRFTPGGADAEGLLLVGIMPHTPAPMLLEGRVRLDSAGALVAVEGRLSQLPSFWTRRVDIERRYAQVAGYRVPTLMHSRAEVRVAGTGTFDMRYSYHEINGRIVGVSPDDDPIAPIRRPPHIVPANHVGGRTSMRKCS